MVDHSSRWLEAIPISSTDTATIAAAFTSNWIAHFGVPDHLTSDCGPQFCSALWSELLRRWGISHHLTTAYHPQANRMVERVHRQLKDALRVCTAGGDWASHLPWVVLGLRVAPKEDSNMSSAELVYREPLVTPGQVSGQVPKSCHRRCFKKPSERPYHTSPAGMRCLCNFQKTFLLPLWIHLSSTFVVAALRCRCRPPTANPLQ